MVCKCKQSSNRPGSTLHRDEPTKLFAVKNKQNLSWPKVFMSWWYRCQSWLQLLHDSSDNKQQKNNRSVSFFKYFIYIYIKNTYLMKLALGSETWTLVELHVTFRFESHFWLKIIFMLFHFWVFLFSKCFCFILTIHYSTSMVEGKLWLFPLHLSKHFFRIYTSIFEPPATDFNMEKSKKEFVVVVVYQRHTWLVVCAGSCTVDWLPMTAL